MARVGWAWVLICVVSSMSAVGLCNLAVHLEKYVHIMRQIYPIQEDPEVHMNVSELITSKGYPCEEYTVQTDDGFLLGVQRIPHGLKQKSGSGPKPVVFLQHGLLCSSTNWVTNLVDQSFAFLLADAGYDVWLGNMRGNTYSRKHIKLSPDSDEFWAWSWDEMAKFDLPAMLNFALKTTAAEDLYYIGHSQGTLIGFAQFSQDPKLAKKVKRFFALGPVTTTKYIISPIRLLVPFISEIELLFKLLGVRDFLPNNELVNFLASTVCDEATRFLCADILFVLAGFDLKQLNETRLPVYLHHTPAGTSVRNMVHFVQLVKSGKFQMYDYGSANRNMQHYKQKTPQNYHVERMSTDVVLFWAQNDWLADPQDVKQLIPKLKNLSGSYRIPDWDHLDFIWGMDAAEVIYHPIINMMNADLKKYV